ncbi:6-pyruvoyl tetrahydropterin synthase [Candidatus Gugararchaeum adminiculabundum]|nr:6-pyruvoyl tetrahydropterin synthase [Candidatus Gugararchaeum adminiculabundum]
MYKLEIHGKTFAASHSDSLIKGEPLHGHNYRPIVLIEHDKLTDGMVIDFRIVKKLLNEITAEFDHKVLLGKKDVKEIKGETVVCHSNYSVPKKDAVLLDEDYAMCELLAQRVYRKLEKKLPKFKKLEVKIWETEYGAASFSE